jgi:ABC-type lipoprotein export system ATPase subunit
MRISATMIGRAVRGRAAAGVAARGDAAGYGRDAHVVCDNLVRIYSADGIEVVALQGLDLLVERGELIAVVGPSGSGKSTLLNILSGLDTPTAGLVRVGGQDLLGMSARDRLRYRRRVVGFVWQQTARSLLPYLTAAENVALPLSLAGAPRRERTGRADELLDLLSVAHCRDRRPEEMSGGEQQRVAIAVAVANSPEVLLADEPTGELDTATADEVFAALRWVNESLGVTVVVVTHDAQVTRQVQRTVAIRDGRTSAEVLQRTERDEHGRESVVAEEYAVLDRVGRLQLPQDFIGALELERRVRLALEPDHIGVWPDRRNGSAPAGGAAGDPTGGGAGGPGRGPGHG